jgi:NitT/TauT family transport system ATP-binding protein
MLELEDIVLQRGPRTLLAQAQLRLEPAERLGLVGPSGAGKSSLLSVIAGTLPIQAGRIRNDFLRVGIAYQQPRLLPWRSVIDNVRIPLRATGFGRRAATATARDWLHWVGLEQRLHDWPGQLSGGEAHRVALARAFSGKPDLLLLDEPFSALDPALRQQMRALCNNAVRITGAALLYVSHHPLELTELVDRCVNLELGRLRPYPLPRRSPAPPRSSGRGFLY